MGKAASHFIWCSGRICRLHYLQWDEEGCFAGIYPLEEEIAGVVFFNGTLVPVRLADSPAQTMSPEAWQDLAAKVVTGCPIRLYHVDGDSFQEVPVTRSRKTD